MQPPSAPMPQLKARSKPSGKPKRRPANPRFADTTTEPPISLRTALGLLALLVALLGLLQLYVLGGSGREPPPPPRPDRPDEADRPKLYSYKIVAEHDHDPAAFTQGLLCEEGSGEGCARLWESTGLYGESSVRLVERETGKVLRRQDDIDRKHFGAQPLPAPPPPTPPPALLSAAAARSLTQPAWRRGGPCGVWRRDPDADLAVEPRPRLRRRNP